MPLEMVTSPQRRSTVVYVGSEEKTNVKIHQYNDHEVDDDDDENVSDDPAWYHAPRGSLQPAFPVSVLQKRESQRSDSNATASTSSDGESPHSNRTVVAYKNQLSRTNSIEPDDHEEDEHCEDEEDEDVHEVHDEEDYFPPVYEPIVMRPSMATTTATRRSSSSPSSITKAATIPVPVRAKSSTSKLGEVKRLSLERLSGSDLSSGGGGKSSEQDSDDRLSTMKPRISTTSYQSSSNMRISMDMRGSMDMGGRESMMKYRPSDLTVQDLKTDFLRRDSLAALHDGSGGGGGSSYDLLASSRGSVSHIPRQSDAELPELLRAAKTGNMLLLKACLQDQSTKVTQRDAVHGQSALHLAVRHGQFAAVRLLCQKKHTALLIDAVDSRNNTPLHLAAARSRRITKFLLEHGGANVTQVNTRGQTALGVHILTTRRDDPLVTEMLLQHKANANAQLDSSTLLHKAVELKHFEIACRLVRYGARLDIKDENGKMVFDKVNRKVLRQLINKISYPPVWVANEERPNCMLCSRKFSKFRVGVRRHHCRHCGRLCCGQCSHVSVESVAFPKTFENDNRQQKGSRARHEHMKRVCKTCSSVFHDRERKPQEENQKMNQFMAKTFGCEWEEMTDQQQTAPRRSSMGH